VTGEEPARSVFIGSDALGSYSFSEDHPFKPERIRLVYRMCSERGLFSGAGIGIEEVEEGEPDVLERFHTLEYIDALRRADSGTEVDVDMLHHGIGSQENPIFKGVYRFCELSATASLAAARRVSAGALSAFNPCGGFHHAHPDRASGFCYVNDVVIAIEELRVNGLRAAYLDIDAHHGDAVQEAYYSSRDVLTISMHESGKTLFPWGGFERETGAGEGEGFNINLPLEPDTDDEIFLYIFGNVVMDALALYAPDVVVLQAGTDMLVTDPLTHLRLTNNGYIEAVELLHERHPRIVALGGGGYNMNDVVRAWTLLWAELSGQALEEGYGGALGGVFLGDASLQGSDLRDMRSYTSGPVKEKLKGEAERMIAHYHDVIRPKISPQL
jgi:acetoin utilization protein AcuC